jgi:hypothetical protein
MRQTPKRPYTCTSLSIPDPDATNANACTKITIPDPEHLDLTTTRISTANDLKSTVALNRRLGAANLAAKGQTIEWEAMVLVLQSKAAARLREDLDVASCRAGLWGCCKARCDGAAERLEKGEC